MTTTSAIPEPSHVRTGASRHRHSASNAAAGAAAPATRRLNRASATDPLSDRATRALIRKVLLPQESGDKGRDPQTPIEELLPPLTSRNDVDLQLYAFLAIILRDFVQSWYSKITPDETFVAEIIHVIAHCTRALEQRLRKLDLESLLLHEIPGILNKHITTYRSTHPGRTSQTILVDGREAYHALWPLPFLSPVPISGEPTTTAKQLRNEAAYRQLLVQATVAVLLPTEDLENPCLTALVGQIFSELVIGNAIANKAVQPWLLFEAICIVDRVLAEKRQGSRCLKASSRAKTLLKGPRSWSVQGFFVSIIQVALVLMSTIRFAFNLITVSSSLPPRRRLTTDKKPAPEVSAGKGNTAQDAPSPPAKVPVLAFNAWSCLGNVIELHARMPWLGGFLSLLQLGAIYGPGRIAGLDGVLDRTRTGSRATDVPLNQVQPGTEFLASDLLDLACRRQVDARTSRHHTRSVMYISSHLAPWPPARDEPPTPSWQSPFPPASALRIASAPVASLRHSSQDPAARISEFGFFPAARLLSSRIQLLFSPSHLPPVLKMLRGALFPNNAPGSSSLLPPSSDRELRAIRRRAAKALWNMAPRRVGRLYLGGGLGAALGQLRENEEEEPVDELEGLLNVLGDDYCNKHLMYSVLELILVRLMPELCENGVDDLLRERLG
ncbi:PXA domain protein [Metarhizium album ARSEF 1941]|uniref:PXA domain protein n=1 Tax=Metarhizium album (strain ARSEF 1941) TaxID=1081103 RepID=A0A0B2X0Z6_METAS|nr:PXA domain protein [Metarhizium album ARSEF 1941]KHN99549.1 PXA domain protein [Metarhizium album ARSEF 1941]